MIVQHHPLYQAAEKCIDGEIAGTYNYHDFFPTWNGSPLEYKTIIRDIFKIDGNGLQEFILEGDPRSKYNGLVYLLEVLNQESPTKKLLRFVSSLPMLEYEIRSTRKSTSNSSSASCNKFDKTLSNFKYDNDCFAKIGNDEILNTINAILILSNTEKLIKGLQDFAFRDYMLLQQEFDKELTYKAHFKDYLVDPICSLLVKAFRLNAEVKYAVATDYKVKFHVWPDILIARGKQVFCTIEVKKYQMLSEYNENSTGIVAGIMSQDKIPAFMRQLIVQMVYHKTNMGVLTDAYDVILVEIDLDYFDKYKEILTGHKGSKVIPLRYKVLNCRSAAPTLREGLMHFFFKAIVDDNALKIKQERMLIFREYLRNTIEEFEAQFLATEYSSDRSSIGSRPSTRDTDISEPLPIIDEGIEEEQQLDFDEADDVYMQNGELFSSQLVKYEAYYMKKYLLSPVDDKEKLVAKIYDTRMANTIHYGYVSSPKEVLEQCLNAYNSERLFCQILANDPEFNSCYVQHRRGYIKVTVENHYLAKGNFNLFKFIETATMPRDTETYVKAKNQLEIIHRNGIIHGDIRKANILYTKEGKVFIIDFASSIPENQSTDEINKESDKAALEFIFKDYNRGF
ncbi:unnamed protein product [Debaryomyces tyrocola]|nr:unnamed protein product [Debaryomyces tyrocola]